ncbi:MAG: hypothetical protein P9L99_15860 [Candidatus Lernaella stagnicola]|nr:hypothetical protein [Candidatus Lernaella stagnicola]
MKRSVPYLAVLAALLALGVTFAAARPAFMNIKQMAAEADVVFVGTVRQITEEPNDAGLPTTVVGFDIGQVLKGKSQLADPSVVELRFAGGADGARRLRVSHVPRFAVGERLVVFTRYDGQAYASPIIGLNQGLFRVKTEPATGKDYVVDYGGNALLHAPNGVRIGDVILPNAQGRFEAVTPAASPAVPAPHSADPQRLRIDGARPIPRGTTNRAQLMTLADFIAYLNPLCHGDGQ